MARAPKHQDTYEEPTVIVSGNVIATVYRPILTEEEREFRMKLIAQAAADLLRENEGKRGENP